MASKRGSLSQNKITGELALALEQAAQLMQRKKQRVMTAEILLLAFATTPNVEANQLLRNLSNQHGFNWANFEREVDRAAGDTRAAPDQQFDFVAGNGKRVSLGKEMLIILDDGLTLAENESKSKCGSVHALAAMANIQIGTHWLFQKRGLNQRIILDEAIYSTPSSVTPAARTKTRTRVASTIYHRVKLESKLVNLLSMRSARNVILVGAPGTGKRSLVLGVGQLMVQGNGPFGLRTVVELDERKLLDDPRRAISDAINQAKEAVLFVPDIDRFFGGIRAEFHDDTNTMQKAFLANNVVVIGTATEEAYNKKLKSARVITERSQILKVLPASIKETTEILKAIKPRFETDYDLEIVDKSLDETARLAGRYYTTKPLPGGAVELLHRACAMVKTGGHTGSGVDMQDSTRLDPDDVMITTSLLTGIPVNSMGADERNRYIKMVDQLKMRIIGQDEAVVTLSRAVKIARVGLKDPKRPIGSFLFLGPTGVGKSELAKALAEFMFGTEGALITLDMSEYMDESSVNRLIGSPPGYVGHEAGGQLTDAVKKQPYSVILFDEVEKANRKVFDTLLQVLDEGRLTSGQGETVNFSECVILMTSNIGGEYLADVRMSENIDEDTAVEGSGGIPAYNIENIGTMLAKGFSTNELFAMFGSNLLSFSAADTPSNAGVPAEETEGVDNPNSSVEEIAATDAAPKLDKADIVAVLLQQAEAKSQFELVLELAEAQNPAKFEQHQPYYNWPVACQKAEKALKGHFRPEFLNRLDGIIYFHPLNDKHLRDILTLMLNKERDMLQNQGLDLEVTGAAKSWLIKQNEHPEWGARPLRRLIQNYIREEVAEYILRQNPPPGEVIKVQVQNNEMKISSVKPGK